MNQTLLFYFALTGLIALFVWIILLERRLKKIFRGKKGADLEYILASLSAQTDGLEKEQKQTKERLKEMRGRLETSIQKSAVVRFNPFEDAGGDQSFAIALLDEKDTGLVIASLHGRERTMVYAKPVLKGKSAYPLSKEEAEAIQKAMSND